MSKTIYINGSLLVLLILGGCLLSTNAIAYDAPAPPERYAQYLSKLAENAAKLPKDLTKTKKRPKIRREGKQMNAENISAEAKGEMDQMAYGTKQVKQLCPAATTHIDETWTQVIDTIRDGSHSWGHNLFK